jgi:hypothetical protein
MHSAQVPSSVTCRPLLFCNRSGHTVALQLNDDVDVSAFRPFSTTTNARFWPAGADQAQAAKQRSRPTPGICERPETSQSKDAGLHSLHCNMRLLPDRSTVDMPDNAEE